jgi:hypothetical protein
MSQQIWEQREIISWNQLLLNSFEQFLGCELISRSKDSQEDARNLFFAPFIVVSHDTQSDPILKYGNQIALNLWEMSWENFIQTPSRLTAEPMNREERERMLALANRQGFISDYRGVRISSSGKRFAIESAIVWNLVDSNNMYCGQAATFSRWTYLTPDNEN